MYPRAPSKRPDSKSYDQSPPGGVDLLAKHGLAIEGPHFNLLVSPIDFRSVQQASARDLFEEWVPKSNDDAWLSNSHYQSYLVLNLCRILQTVIHGQASSKKIAGEWVKSTYPQWKDLIEEAERWTYGDQMRRQSDSVAFLRFAVDRVNGTRILCRI